MKVQKSKNTSTYAVTVSLDGVCLRVLRACHSKLGVRNLSHTHTHNVQEHDYFHNDLPAIHLHVCTSSEMYMYVCYNTTDLQRQRDWEQW